MERKGITMIVAAASLFLFVSGLAYAQDKTTAKEVQTSSAPAPADNSEDVQWLWGEVVAVNASNKEIRVKYVDYETDTEKEVSMFVDDKTTYENIKSLDEIKPQDGVTIDYLVNAEGKNIAQTVSLEKTEELESSEEDSIKDNLKKDEGQPDVKKEAVPVSLPSSESSSKTAE
ncbi:MAG: hypothetical protein PHE58_06210 [Candidatus Omnitrophica bacterium]|nr:hypothetical protein [Candidatus Omnitrophota bacterium]